MSCRVLSVVDRGRSRPTRIPCLASSSFSSWLKLKRRRMDNDPCYHPYPHSHPPTPSPSPPIPPPQLLMLPIQGSTNQIHPW
ncbi:hypothetical protein HZH68_007820 [Vespula germanica]|uniref:Uncharacterized protein n=1 Tax=Vespula germanica TaxID=30212 RepID=A0A834N9F4_VESGE|nr:hypothetical protein HZH68_007820 [Vespula germanica]